MIDGTAVQPYAVNSEIRPSRKDLTYYKRRYERARGTADLWINYLNVCYHYSIPSRNLYYWMFQTQGLQKNAQVYDTTLVWALRNFVTRIQNAMVPPGQEWALFEAGEDIEPDYVEEVNKKLQVYAEKVFNYIRRSNFDVIINECFYDLGIGTAALIIAKGKPNDPLKFYSIPLARIAIEESVDNIIESCYRWYYEMPIRDMLTMWPNIQLTEAMKMLYANDPNASVGTVYEGVSYCPEDKLPYKYNVWAGDDWLLQEEMISSPWVVFRWSKISEETMGRGPVMDALPSALSLNELARLELASANLNVCRPFMAASDGVFNPYTFNLQPNTVIPVSSTSAASGKFPLVPLPDTANPQFAQLQANELRMQINNLMFNNAIGPITEATKSATEIALRQRNLIEEMGALARLQVEFLPRVMKRIIFVLQSLNLIEPISINGRQIQIKYKSPLTVAQGQQNVKAMVEYMQVAASFYGQEGAVSATNPPKMLSWLAQNMGVDLQPLNNEQEIADTLQKFQGMAEQATQAEQGQAPAVPNEPMNA